MKLFKKRRGVRKLIANLATKLAEMQNDLVEAFNNVKKDVRHLNDRITKWAQLHQQLRSEFEDLREELATNGVVRDLRSLQREFADFREFKQHAVVLLNHLDESNQNLQTNGVATAINNLQLEVFGKQKQSESVFGNASLIHALSGGSVDLPDEPTLAGKVDAIIEHLGLDVTVAPKEVKEAKVVAKKKPAAKKRRRY